MNLPRRLRELLHFGVGDVAMEISPFSQFPPEVLESEWIQVVFVAR